MYAPNKTALKYMKQKLTKLKGKQKNLQHTGRFLTPLSATDRKTDLKTKDKNH